MAGQGVWRVQRGRPPTAAQPEAEAQARDQRAEHERRGPAPHLAKPGVQPGAESSSGGLGVPRGRPILRGQARGMTSP
jgi:hypothetical protein